MIDDGFAKMGLRKANQSLPTGHFKNNTLVEPAKE
jgi:hypothetical protein